MSVKAMSRSLKSRQVGLKKLYVSVNGTAATPVASGLDAKFVESVTDHGTGDYTIKLKLPAQADLIPDGIASKTANASGVVDAVNKQEITLNFFDEAGDPVDADFNLGIIYPEIKHVF
jgi:hypothetical protein